MPRKRVEKRGDLPWDAGADEHVVDAGEECAIYDRCRRQLHLLKEIDPHRPRVSVLRQKDLDEPGEHGKRLQVPRRSCGEHGHVSEGRAVALGARHEISLDHRARQIRIGKCRRGAAQPSVRIPSLEATGEDDVERGARDHAEMTEA